MRHRVFTLDLKGWIFEKHHLIDVIMLSRILFPKYQRPRLRTVVACHCTRDEAIDGGGRSPTQPKSLIRDARQLCTILTSGGWWQIVIRRHHHVSPLALQSSPMAVDHDRPTKEKEISGAGLEDTLASQSQNTVGATSKQSPLPQAAAVTSHHDAK